MIKICYSLNEAINIYGSWKEMESIRQEILRFIKTDLKEIDVEIEKNISATPWDFVATGLKIIQNDNPVKVSISGETVIEIAGSKENLEIFTSFLYFDENTVSRSHSHYEYYEGNESIHPDSFP